MFRKPRNQNTFSRGDFMKQYFKDFFSNEDGAETIEFVAILGVAVLLIGVIVKIGTAMKGRADTAKDALDNIPDK